VSREPEGLRRCIRAGVISPEINRKEWEEAVARIYEIERAEEATAEGAAASSAPGNETREDL